MTHFLEIVRREAPLVVSFPHTGIDLAPEVEAAVLSRERAIGDTDWFIHELYDFVHDLGATVVRTRLSRTVIDVNRDPSGASLYSGRATTDLCPTTTFDGERLYHPGRPPDEAEIARRRALYFEPYHKALGEEIARLRARHPRVVLYDAHSIRSVVPRLFKGELPQFNIGTADGASCDPALAGAVGGVCRSSPYSTVVDGRFKGGWITRAYGRPGEGVHAVQMELAIRGYMDEPTEAAPPRALDRARARPLAGALARVIEACLVFAQIAPTRGAAR